MFLKNKNIIFKIRRSKVTDYAALRDQSIMIFSLKLLDKRIQYLLTTPRSRYRKIHQLTHLCTIKSSSLIVESIVHKGGGSSYNYDTNYLYAANSGNATLVANLQDAVTDVQSQ